MNLIETVTDVIIDAKDSASYFMTEEIPTTRKQMLTTCTIIALIGIVVGFIFSPIKKGFYFNISDNGNYIPDGKSKESKKEPKKNR